MSATRRDVLRVAGPALATGGLTAALAAPAAADHFDTQPDHVSLTYDEDLLNTYRPRLVLSGEARDKLIALYGWIASSPEFDTSVACYWASYTHQEGFLGNLDSHFGDHEPVHVEYDSQTGDVVRVRASVYHWLKGEVTADAAPLYEDTHPHLKVIDPWHQYTAATQAGAGVFLDVEDLTAVFEDWLSNGLEQDLRPGSTTRPWIMREATSWWRDTVGGFSADESFFRVARSAGIDTAGSLET